MTLDGAIKHAETVAEEHTKYNIYGGFESCDECATDHRQLAEWLKELKRLKDQEPCEDAISRQAVIDITWEEPSYTDALNVLTEVRDKVKALPTVNPQEPKTDSWSIKDVADTFKKHGLIIREQEPKTGHWIEEIDDYGKVTGWHCDKCYEDSGFTTDCKWDFCPNCGTKMEDSDADSN